MCFRTSWSRKGYGMVVYELEAKSGIGAKDSNKNHD